MQCNIDQSGRLLRTSLGIVFTIVGAVLFAANRLGWLPGWALSTGIAAMLGGGFMIFEGVNGWCAVRAMGFKTPI
jgi:hypothetical protein